MASADEKSAVEKLKQMVKDIKNDLTHFDALRWLQAYEFDFDKTLPPLRAHLKIMNSWDFANYEPHAIARQYWPSGLLGPNVGKDECEIVYMECTGRIDSQGFINAITSTQFYRARIYLMETIMKTLRQQEAKTGKQCRILFVYDFQNMEYSKALLNVITGRYKTLSNYFTSHYPEVFGKLIAINIPGFLTMPIEAFRPFFSQKLNDSAVFLGADWKTEILKHIDAKVLPETWGGNRPDAASPVVIPETKIPTDLYWTPEKAKYPDDQLTSLNVASGTMEYVTVHVTKADTSLEWYFQTNNGWGFGVYYTQDEQETNSDAMEMVFPEFTQYPYATVTPENDTLLCRKVGFYKLKFNNHHAWLATLNVRYKLVIK